MDKNIQQMSKEFLDLINKVGSADIIISTDTNSHCTLWNCVNTDSRGKFVEDFIIKITSNALMWVIIGLFRVLWVKSIIDVTLSNYSLANKISDWKVENHL